MKKLLLIFLTLIFSVSVLSSCADIDKIISGLGDNTHEDGGHIPEEIPDENKEQQKSYKYTDFSPTEKSLFTRYIGEIIPFAPNDEYYLEGYNDIDDYENGINFYTVGNDLSDFDDYRKLFSSYTLTETFEDEYGDRWYCYQKGELLVDMCFYVAEGKSYIDVYVCLDADEGGNENGGNEGGNDGTGYIYTDFTEAEKATIRGFLGQLIPFVPNSEYYVEEGYDEYYECDYLGFYTFGNNENDFDKYLDLYSSYTLTETFEDEDGDTWYCYEKGDVYIELSFYYYEGDYVIDVYAYYLGDDAGEAGGNESGGNEGGSGSDADLITNQGAGLPAGNGGIFNIDFTKADKVKNVTDQGYYLDGCPTVGSPAVLVIPVEFSDARASSKGYTIDSINAAFTGQADYYSLYDYYRISSDGQLTLDITVIDEWFCPKYNSSYYAEATFEYYGSDTFIGDQLILDEALAYLSTTMDLSEFDTDGNGIIDSVVLINTLEINDENDFNWAYRYWNIYTDDEGYYYEYDSVSANDYLWMSCGFIHESVDDNGDYIYTDTSVINTYTLIHEFGHVLGADDYYNTTLEGEHPMDGFDVMDSMTGDHNPYTKFNFGWITTSRLVTTEDSITLTLESFSTSGDSIIIANNWDPSLGAYQEYYIVVYYTMDGLNGGDYGYFSRDGIVVYHVNASLYKEEIDGEIYYDVYNNNTDPTDEYGTEDNLIEFVKTAADTFTYVEGDSLPTVTDDNGSSLIYGFTVDSLTDSTATLTFTRK